MWVKRGSLATGNSQYLIMSGTGTSNNTNFTFLFQTDNTLSAGQYSETPFTNTAVFRDPAAWYHIVITYDSTQATAANRFKLYVNNQLFTSSTTITQNNEWAILQSGQEIDIGRHTGVGRTFDGYMTEINLIDGQALTPNSFGTFNSYGVWQPITYGGSYGTNGFYLPFTNITSTTTLGYDFSPNGNNWTTNNISLTAGSTYDSMTDVPTLTSATTANYAVLNPLTGTGSDIGNGNLGIVGSGAGDVHISTIAIPTTGKWYAEFLTFNYNASHVVGWFGVCNVNGANFSGLLSRDAVANGGWYQNDSQLQALQLGSINQVFGVAVDRGANTVQIYINGVLQTGQTPTLATGVDLFFYYGTYTGSTGWANFGQQPWQYTPPTGFVALNTYNL
jgi:hypothetical protein